MDATQPAATESRLDRLVRLRGNLEAVLNEGVPVRDFATLSREYRAVLADIDTLAEPEKKGDAVDEIAQRRAARRSGAAKGAGRSKRSS